MAGDYPKEDPHKNHNCVPFYEAVEINRRFNKTALTGEVQRWVDCETKQPVTWSGS